MQLIAWEGEQQNELSDMMELHGVLDVTASALRKIMREMAARASMTNTPKRLASQAVGTTDVRSTSYLDVYGEICAEQVLFTSEFLQWQLRFGNMVYLLADDSVGDGSS